MVFLPEGSCFVGCKLMIMIVECLLAFMYGLFVVIDFPEFKDPEMKALIFFEVLCSIDLITGFF